MTKLRIVPIGGLGEIGMNLMVYEFEDSAIAVDCGMMFPDAATMGVDVVIPDMTYLFENAWKFKAIFLTHGHEDHIGALPFLAERVPVPVYGMPLTLGFVRHKLEEFGMKDDVDLRTMSPRDVVEAGPFAVEAIRVTHSIVDAMALAIRTPAGTIIHTGDFKLDQNPIDRNPADLARFAAHGEEGVLVLVSDSTGATEEGFTRSESTVGNAFTRIFHQAPGRIIVTTFASHIHRVQQIVDAAQKTARRVSFVGRSMVNNMETAERLGYLKIPRNVRAGDEPEANGVIVTTGTQGEPSSALAKMALNEHRTIELQKKDTVIISARTIPGNEKAVSRVVDHLYQRGADVMYHEVPDIHVSGHASADELRLMINLTKPRYFIPMHGTVRHLVLHERIAHSVGIPPDRTFLLMNGNVAELDEASGRILPDRVPAGKVFIDRQSEEVASVVVRDRKHLAEDGFVIAVVALNFNSGDIVREPEIITRGLVHVDASAEMLTEVRELLTDMLVQTGREELGDADAIQEKMRVILKRYFRKKLNRRPMILPVVWEM